MYDGGYGHDGDPYANIADTLTAFTIQRTPHGVTINDAALFLEAVVTAVDIYKLRVIATGLGSLPVSPNVNRRMTATTRWHWRSALLSLMSATL